MRWNGGLGGSSYYDPDYEPTPIERWCGEHIFEIVIATVGGPVVIAFIIQALKYGGIIK
jgi:hypothetical protein